MISRTLSPTLQAALTSNPSRTLAFVELEWPSGWVRVHSGIGTRSHNGNEYLGVGEFGGISDFSEDAKSSANRMQLSLRIMDNTLLGEVMNNDPNGRDCFIHLVALDENRQIVESQDYVFDGRIVDVQVKRGDIAKEIPAQVSITCSDWFERWAQAPEVYRTTDAAQQHLHPGDKFFDQVEVISGSPLHSLPFKRDNGASEYGDWRGGPGRITP